MSEERAASFFRVTKKHVRSFERLDPFNDVVVKGFICRKKGKMGGSLLITHVDGKEVEPQEIHGTPKLAYPYKDHESTEYLDFFQFNPRWFFLAEKWNGMNVLFFKYKDADGKELISAKSKGAPFLGDGEYGNFLTLCRKALERNPNALDVLKQDSVAAASFELCGKEEPHLVDYDFDIALKPLFRMDEDGRIRPMTEGKSLAEYTNSAELEAYCEAFQEADYELNRRFREERGLALKYEYEHFATEGKVLYLLNSHGVLIERTMYKIKPKDVEEVHWQSFDDVMEGRVKEAIQKIHLNEDEVTAETLQQELDMGPKEWGKFGRKVLKFVDNLEV